MIFLYNPYSIKVVNTSSDFRTLANLNKIVSIIGLRQQKQTRGRLSMFVVR